MTEAAIREAVHRAEAASNYPEAVQILIEAGVRLYHTDVKTRTILYSSDRDCYADHGKPLALDSNASPGPFDTSAIAEALSAIDRKETDYQGFLSRLWHAGVVEYDVSLMGRQIIFCGPNGESHLQPISLP